jgi:mannan endo-1,4-beta-mannosidase
MSEHQDNDTAEKRILLGKPTFDRRIAAIIAGALAVIGIVVVVFTHASGYSVVMDVVKGTLTGSATVVADSTAIGGNKVVFNGPSTPTSYNDTLTGTGQNQFNFVNAWYTSTCTNCYQTDNHFTDDATASYSFQFSGTQAKIFGEMGPNIAIMAISVDGGSEVMIDGYSSSKQDSTLQYTTPVMNAGTHTVKVRNSGNRNAAAVASYIVADRVDVYATGSSVASATPTPAPTATPVPPTGGTLAGATGKFYIVGKDIIDPTGHKYFPVGANIGTPGNFDWNGNAMGHVADAKAWGWNTVRVNIYCTDLNTWSYVAHNGLQAQINQVNQLIAEYTAQKVVVMVTCHDANYDDSNWGYVEPRLKQFWTAFAPTVKNNPYVWFNPLNEAFWNQNEAFVSFNADYYNLFRNMGAENIMVADVENDGNDVGWYSAKSVYDPTMGPALAATRCNILFSQHNYGGWWDTATYPQFYDDYYTQVQKAGLAMIVGEYGYQIPTVQGNNKLASQTTWNQAAAHGIGGLWWHATHGDGYYLKNDGAAFYGDGSPSANLSPGGTSVWNYAHANHDLGSFTGSYKSSHCASAQ